MEANCGYFIPSFESRPSDSSEFEENRQIHKVDGYVHDDTNLISNIKTTPNRLVCCSSTSDDESSDHLRPNTPIGENTAQFPAATHIESSVHNDRATSTDSRKHKRKGFFS
ncbi:hypothetical protein AVEN_111940-1 [Araneus ventricosus]|uniref:Uncharacterized protein n=1 Tax=Araneus ventricosus TaxID=182803 RepID=A0A4Y2Q9N7_ARAVE|nr:hypothetical protein AVEN_111940-1 [Araneus ventricosus]